jgi:hypothetical protein
MCIVSPYIPLCITLNLFLVFFWDGVRAQAINIIGIIYEVKIVKNNQKANWKIFSYITTQCGNEIMCI